MGCLAEGEGITEDCLDLPKPAVCECAIVNGHFRGVVEHRRAEKLQLRLGHFGSLGFYGFLILLLAESQLPRDILEMLALHGLVYQAQEAEAGHRVRVDMFARVVLFECVQHVLDCFWGQLGGQVLCPGGWWVWARGRCRAISGAVSLKACRGMDMDIMAGFGCDP